MRRAPAEPRTRFASLTPLPLLHEVHWDHITDEPVDRHLAESLGKFLVVG